jgi:hypothetical protein
MVRVAPIAAHPIAGRDRVGGSRRICHWERITGNPEGIRARSLLRGSQPRLPQALFLDSVGPLVVLQSNDSDIVKISQEAIVVSNRHGGLPISFRVTGRATKRILKAVHL